MFSMLDVTLIGGFWWNGPILVMKCFLPNEVIDIVNVSKAKKVVVTHLYPRCDQEKVVETIRANVGVEVLEAQDLLVIEI